MSSFGITLKQVRENRGLSLSKLAKAAGLHYSTLGRIERSERAEPRQDTLAAIIKGFTKALGYQLTPQEVAMLYESCGYVTPEGKILASTHPALHAIGNTLEELEREAPELYREVLSAITDTISHAYQAYTIGKRQRHAKS